MTSTDPSSPEPAPSDPFGTPPTAPSAGAAPAVTATGSVPDTLPGSSSVDDGPSVLPYLYPGGVVEVPGRGEVFVRRHRHADAAAPTVLLLHGWTASADLQFFTAYRALAEVASVIAVDHQGHGRGIRSIDEFELATVADDAAGVVRALDVGPVVAVGYSMGGPVSMLLARRHPDLVSGLVVQATAMEWRARLRDRLSWWFLPFFGTSLRSRFTGRFLERRLPKVLGGTPLEPVGPWLLAEMRRSDPTALVEAGRELRRYDARPWASELGVPSGALVTTRDRLVSARKQRALATALSAEVRELVDDHFAPLTSPQRYAELTAELVTHVARRAGSTPS